MLTVGQFSSAYVKASLLKKKLLTFIFIENNLRKKVMKKNYVRMYFNKNYKMYAAYEYNDPTLKKSS